MFRFLPSSASPTGRRSIKDGGFTLVELIAVISLLAVVAAVCVPSLASMGQTRAAAAARQLLHDLSYARESAQTTGLTHWVAFDVAGNRYSLAAETAGSPGHAGALAITDPATGNTYSQFLGSAEFVGVSLTSVSFSSTSEVGFDAIGRPLSASASPLNTQGSVLLTGGHGITIEPGTGCIQLVIPP